MELQGICVINRVEHVQHGMILVPSCFPVYPVIVQLLDVLRYGCRCAFSSQRYPVGKQRNHRQCPHHSCCDKSCRQSLTALAAASIVVGLCPRRAWPWPWPWSGLDGEAAGGDGCYRSSQQHRGLDLHSSSGEGGGEGARDCGRRQGSRQRTVERVGSLVRGYSDSHSQRRTHGPRIEAPLGEGLDGFHVIEVAKDAGCSCGRRWRC